uniref:F-box domain-containing protein n=1 Tax=Timspurckia oligopyrenoides TaxID=708627 RepID=A0A7S0ZHW9_9RHOD|mmetsp:Transcript_5947/g.10560  ORF Transcript_5947/g.10560 Transcript_5947/m.10560 type:complete len:322 (+) Transcript_5947:229-1194(+)|eukprot:CAMPEP_0182445354 /NCGR_PEP_ID=MMETSP1172-20130603/3507_1 /TAXON_ID=708627 /ORGANISM="Timspurckia oligopyrenoides, Strain CCMP3278" /LENGTH=321 /DNA_ID=CAMNT_0024641109 /DNA_START=112 /DNA_END=1077 /DNA_ORIENTATION=-
MECVSQNLRDKVRELVHEVEESDGFFSVLPDDLISKCISYAAADDVQILCRLSGVSHNFRDVVKRDGYSQLKSLKFDFNSLNIPNEILRDQVIQILRRCPKVEELSFCGNEWLVDDDLIMFIGINLRNLKKLDLRRCLLVTGKTFEFLNGSKLTHLVLDGCNPICSESLFKLAWRSNPLMGTDSEDSNETQSPVVRFSRRNVRGFRFPNLKHLALNYSNNVDDKYLVMLSGFVSNLEHLSVRGCKNVTLRGAHAVCSRVQSLKLFDVSFCPQLDVQLLMNSMQCIAESPASQFFSLEEWTSCGLAFFVSKHPGNEGLRFVL